ncbi:MAG: electron transfer flavoprotein subunit beta/FixA family protein [Desulfurococcales archaeon]|nr:electron transfer flavoprotein subunit beta/FixA family protein [Desulfurococcales archaeon]
MGDIVVLVKPALNPDMLRSKPDGTVDIVGIPLKFDDIDANAIEAAKELKKNLGGKIIAVLLLPWGPTAKRSKDLRMVTQEALARGADEAIVIADDTLLPGDQVITANVIAETIKKHVPNASLILVAEASIDQTTGQIGGRIAAKLGYPYISYARSIKAEGDKIVVERDVEDRIEIMEARLPAVVSVTQEINEPRPPTLLQIRRAGKKPQHKLSASDLGITVERKKEPLEYRILTVSRKQIIIEGDTLEEIAEKLIEALEKEGVLSI